MRFMLKTAILAASVAVSMAAANRFVHTDGKHIVAPGGEKLLLRGINLGNWLVPEGYMFHFDKGPASYREISALFNDLVGPDEAARFWKQYRDTYIAECRYPLHPRSRIQLRAHSVSLQADRRRHGVPAARSRDRVVPTAGVSG